LNKISKTGFYLNTSEKRKNMGTAKINTKVYGYLRVSTLDQNTEKNEADILRYANTHNFGKVEFISEKVSGMKSWRNRKLFNVVQNLNEGDILIVPELSRLARSLIQILEILTELSAKNVKVYSVKENFQLNGDDMQSKVMRTMLSLFSEIERDLIVARTKEGIKAVKAQGKILGRPTGIGKSRLDQFQVEIVSMLKNGVQKKFIAKRYNVSPATLTHWVKTHNINTIGTDM
jgi:DNA invertase Pin-like site-specific DNA recombinase